MKRVLFAVSILLFATAAVSQGTEESAVPTTILYHKVLNNQEKYPELIVENMDVNYTPEGMEITKTDGFVRLDKYYSLGERMIRYHVKIAANAVAFFQSNSGDFKVLVNMAEKTVSLETNLQTWKKFDFLNPEHEYLVEISRHYQTQKICIIDIFTGESGQIEVTTDGTGGHGKGVENSGFYAGAQYDYYCFGLQSGLSVLVKQISVIADECDLLLLIYGDSITEPDGYFPTKDFSEAWTQLIMSKVNGKAISSGRGGCTINEVLLRIGNELPYVKAKYVMVTIGTNGGNTEENLSRLVEYILSQGSIPILNNIPCNESGTHTEVNRMIEKVRQKYRIKGCKFDIATSPNFDAKEVDKTTMYYEDYTGSWGQIYHHPNVKGSRLMFIRTLIDTPEIYE